MLLRMIMGGGANIVQVITFIISALVITFLVNPLHECAHAWAALKLGDDTAKRQGRLTLNPMAHIDYLGAMLLLIIGFGWAKPVPIDARNFKNPKVGMALSALAGPVSNLIAATIAGLFFNAINAFADPNVIYEFTGVSYTYNYAHPLVWLLFLFEYLMMINITLAVFNLIPIPPLDGSKILMAFLPDRAIMWIYQREQMISMGLFIIIMLGGFNGILTSAQYHLSELIIRITSLPFVGVG